MKTLVKLGIVFIIIGIIFTFQDKIVDGYNILLIKYDKQEKLSKNEYYTDSDFLFIQNTDTFLPKKKQDLYNIYYTIINSGMDEFTFYCDFDYKNCISDLKEIANDQSMLSNINNFVHPFNSFSHIETEYNNYGKVTIKLEHAYTKDEIKNIKEEINNINNKLNITSDLSDVEKIKLYHDYIISNTKYDIDRSDRGIVNYKSDIAYGPLFEGVAICGGYSDLMALFLSEMNLKNFRVSSNIHIWNAVYLNGNWLNLDLTWDDPITSDGSDMVDNSYFLITTEELESLEKKQHNFNKEIYKEVA